MTDKVMDCGKVPSDTGCTLVLTGRESEVLDAAVAHAVAVHGHEDTPELHATLRGLLEDAPTPGFVQIIDFRTDDIQAIEALHAEWLEGSSGRRTTLREVITADRDEPGRYVVVVDFPSAEAARVNDGLEATQHFSEQVMKLVTEPPTFRNLDLVRVDR